MLQYYMVGLQPRRSLLWFAKDHCCCTSFSAIHMLFMAPFLCWLQNQFMPLSVIRTILQIGGVEQNPGPWHCIICLKEISKAHTSLQCSECRGWLHFRKSNNCSELRGLQEYDPVRYLCSLCRQESGSDHMPSSQESMALQKVCHSLQLMVAPSSPNSEEEVANQNAQKCNCLLKITRLSYKTPP